MKLFGKRTRDTASSSAPRGNDTCLMLDFENLLLGLRDVGAREEVDTEALLRIARGPEETHRVSVARAYADWRPFGRHSEGLARAGIQSIQAASRRLQGRNATDIQMAVDATDLMHRNPALGRYVLVTGDSDFTPLVRLLQERGIHVVGVGVEGSVSPHLREACDEYVHYVPSPAAGSAGTKAPPARTPRGAAPAPAGPSGSAGATPAVSGDTDPHETLGIASQHHFRRPDLVALLPRAAECVRQAQPRYARDLKKALIRRFQGEVAPVDAEQLANLMFHVDLLPADRFRSWFAQVRNGEEAFDGLLAAMQAKLRTAGWDGAEDPAAVAGLLLEGDVNRAEYTMRLARGRTLLQAGGAKA